MYREIMYYPDPVYVTIFTIRSVQWMIFTQPHAEKSGPVLAWPTGGLVIEWLKIVKVASASDLAEESCPHDCEYQCW